jgi:hypothetical protein
MTLRLSTAARDHITSAGSLKSAFQQGQIQIYSGSQPASADAAPTGTLLATITAGSSARTAEVLATGTVTLTAGSSGSVNDITVGGVSIMDGAVPFNTDLTATAAAVAANINAARTVPDYTATSAGAVVTISAPRGMGTAANGLTVAADVTTLTATVANMSGGVTAANGLKFGAASGGVVSKLDTQVWSGVAVASGTAGWFRFTGSVADTGVLDTGATQVRMDGAIATSGAQLNMSSTAITSGATQTIASFPITLPTA